MRHAPDGSVLDVGRKTRTILPAIRRALLARDRRCQFPGCTARRCDGHHIRHWADGGPTRLDNLTLLCRRHHRAVHEGAFTIVQRDDGSPVFHRPDGTCVEIAPAMHRADLAATPPGCTATRHTMPNVASDPFSTMPGGDGAPLDVVWAIDVLGDRASQLQLLAGERPTPA
jgi:HNH endonuclease